jgi:hypothetical protein
MRSGPSLAGHRTGPRCIYGFGLRAALWAAACACAASTSWVEATTKASASNARRVEGPSTAPCSAGFRPRSRENIHRGPRCVRRTPTEEPSRGPRWKDWTGPRRPWEATDTDRSAATRRRKPRANTTTEVGQGRREEEPQVTAIRTRPPYDRRRGTCLLTRDQGRECSRTALRGQSPHPRSHRPEPGGTGAGASPSAGDLGRVFLGLKLLHEVERRTCRLL